MISYEEGLARLLGAIPRLPTEAVPLLAAGNRVLAEDLAATLNLPPFDNSSMDGYAVRAADAGTGARLKLIGGAAAGRPFTGSVAAGTAVRVFTGSPLPAGADAVLMQEDTEVAADGGFIGVRDGVKPWENVRFAGEDVRVGQRLVSAGAVLTPQKLGLLASQGLATLPVFRRARVALLPNGSELVAVGGELGAGQIYESNTPPLRALLASVGAEVTVLPPPKDEPELVVAALREGFRSAEVVVTVGGASVGDHDLVRPAFQRLGGQLDFWKLALKPGKPFCFGQLGERFLFGLPGNPVSAFVTAVLLVLPALRKLHGEADPEPRTTPGRLAEALANPDRRPHFVRVATDREGLVRAAGPQASHRLGGLAEADGLVAVPAGGELPAGTLVPVIRW